MLYKLHTLNVWVFATSNSLIKCVGGIFQCLEYLI